MKREFQWVQLINLKNDWQKDSENKTCIALVDEASIFVYYSPAKYKRLFFKKGTGFQIENDSIIYDESQIREADA